MLELNRERGNRARSRHARSRRGAADRTHDPVAQRRDAYECMPVVSSGKWRGATAARAGGGCCFFPSRSRSGSRRWSRSVLSGAAWRRRSTIRRAALIGADLVMSIVAPFRRKRKRFLRSLGEPQAREVRFRTMAVFPTATAPGSSMCARSAAIFHFTARWKRRRPVRRSDFATAARRCRGEPAFSISARSRATRSRSATSNSRSPAR